MRTSRQVAIVAALAIAAFLIIAFFAPRHGFFDLNVYYGAVNYWADGGEIYDFLRRNSTYGFTYPPFAAILMSPMAILPWPVVAAIHSLITIALMIWLLWTLLRPLIQSRQWTPWFAVAVAFCLFAVYEPMRETFLFGQVNLILLALVAADLLFLRNTKWGGVGIGLATAIKLTPGIFIIYLLLRAARRPQPPANGTETAATHTSAATQAAAMRPNGAPAAATHSDAAHSDAAHSDAAHSDAAHPDVAHPDVAWAPRGWRRWREPLVASGTAAAATLLSAAIAPDASREFWTTALWDTDRVGALWFISNQSLQGMVARLNPEHPSKLAWIILVLIVLAVWIFRLRKADVWGGLALTGIVGLLISPVTWVHHLVWLLPAFVLFAGTRKRWLQVFAAASYVFLCSRVIWAYQIDFSGFDGFLLSNAYVWITLAMLFLTPLRNESVSAPTRTL